MADKWTAFMQGLAGGVKPMPDIIQKAYALKQQDELKKDALAEQRFAHGITLMGQFKNNPKMQSYFFENFVLPSLQRGKERGIISANIPSKVTPEMFGNDNLKQAISEINDWTKLYQQGVEESKKQRATTNSLPAKVYYQKIDEIINTAISGLTDEADIKRVQDMGSRAAQGTAVKMYQGAEGEDKTLHGAQMSTTQQKAFGIGMGPKSAPQRSFTGPNGKTMRVNQVFDEATGTYKDVGEPWEYKDPGAVVKVTTEARGGGKGELTDDAITIAAQQYIRTGQMPALGMGNAQIRVKVLNKAGELVKASGVDPANVPAFAAEFKATQGALNKMERDYAGFAAFEQGMLKNMDYALSISKKYGNTPLPAANKIVNALRTQTGDPKIVEYANAIYAAAMEYEKIRTAGTSITSAELSVAAQKKAEELINTSQTHGQLVGAAKAMKTDARNIIGSRKGEIGKLKAALKDSPYAGKVNSGTATHRWNPQTQQLEPVGE